ncbi:hypothetical protein L6452_26456 [Arctium lappa]|uniref:Uncharacterized protein n=1 Tax=Arctium lappa TaxID=4217 RepID=A0ACB8ZVQ6_ARCLA|nr:hypothetical protein L6452_26456 [Arctium lappa]
MAIIPDETPTTKLLISSLLLTTFIAISSTAAFAFLFFSSAAVNHHHHHDRPPNRTAARETQSSSRDPNLLRWVPIRGSWICPENYCAHYNGSVPFEDRVDTVLNYFDLPIDEMPVFMMLYFEDPNHQGHMVGPDHPRITKSVKNIDRMIGRLIDGLEKRSVFQDVTIIMVGDHGMVGTCDKKYIYLDDLGSWIEIPEEWVQSVGPVLSIRPPSDRSVSEVVAKMNEGLRSGKVKNGDKLRVYRKEDLPERLHYSGSERIPPIIGLVEEGFKIELKDLGNPECAGAHGYDNAFFSMRTIFIGHGPRFARGRKVPTFENVEIYNLITSILGINGAPNNGSSSFAKTMLLPHNHH